MSRVSAGFVVRSYFVFSSSMRGMVLISCRRRQYQHEALQYTVFVKLHDVRPSLLFGLFYSVSGVTLERCMEFFTFQAFTMLEKEIEDALPQFQELLFSLK